MDKGIYGLDLIINLELQVDAYEQDRQKYWENQSETGNIDSAIDFDRAERFAKAVTHERRAIDTCTGDRR